MTEVRRCPTVLMGPAIVFVAVLTTAHVARGDVGFAKWGMTPEQVVAASAGTAQLIPPAKRWRDSTVGWEMAVEGVVKQDELTLKGGYMFDTHSGGLTCVLYNTTGDNVGTLRDRLIARYGRPRKDSAFGSLQTLSWKTPDEVELAINQSAVTAAVSHCAAGG